MALLIFILWYECFVAYVSMCICATCLCDICVYVHMCCVSMCYVYMWHVYVCYVCIYVLCVCMYMCTCVYLYMCCVYMCICVYVHMCLCTMRVPVVKARRGCQQMGTSMWTCGWWEPNPRPLEELQGLSNLCVCFLALCFLWLPPISSTHIGKPPAMGSFVVGTELITQHREGLTL